MELALHALADGVIDTLLEVRRRVDVHFERTALALPHDDSEQRLVRCVAQAMGVPVRDAAADGDEVGALLRLNLRHAGSQGAARAMAQADWAEQVARRASQRLATAPSGPPARFASLPGVQRRSAPDGQVHYLRAGHGPEALLLVNAFGLTLDVWHALARALLPRFTLLVIDDDPPSPELPRVYYDRADSLPRFLHGVRAALAAEGLARCHVASWCSGGKFALELARALPDSIASLALFAPSFAGIEGTAGADSAFEASLHTMCTLVERMPQSADSMARSMLALMKKNDSAHDPLASPFERADQATLHWLHAPYASAAHMLAYSRQLLQFRAHQPTLDAARLTLPVMLVTGQRDGATCSLRARDICRRVCAPVEFELQHAGHYFIHQNSALVAQLLQAFVAEGTEVAAPHPRFVRVASELDANEDEAALVSGEL